MKLLLAVLVALGLFSGAALAQGVNRICVQSVNSVTGANNCVDVSPANPLPTTAGGGVGGGATSAAFCTGCANAALTNTVVGVSSAAAHSLYHLHGYNQNTTVCYLQLFDVVFGSVVLGTTAPKDPVPLLPTAGFDITFSADLGGAYSNQISAAVTTTPSGSTACSSAISTTTFYYK